MVKVGLTGGIASGKTSVANWFAEKGLPVINADQVVHELMALEPVISAVRREFGPEVIRDGRIDRSLLGEKVFGDAKARARLEKIIHPLTARAVEEKCAALEKEHYPLVILDVPLLFEAGWDKKVDQVWVVYVPPVVQKKRLIQRNGFSSEEAERRISSQMPLEEKTKKADIVIDNSGSWEKTEAILRKIWQEIVRL